MDNIGNNDNNDNSGNYDNSGNNKSHNSNNKPDIVKFISIISSSSLFKTLKQDRIIEIFNNFRYTLVEYLKSAIIASEEDECNSLGILLQGRIEIQKIYPSGRMATLATFSPGDTFGEALVFSKSMLYPSTITTIEPVKVLFINRTCILHICSRYPEVLSGFMELLSNRILMLSKKLTELSYDTIRQKICIFLLEENKKQKSKRIKPFISRKRMAEHMGIQRPSLSRELAKMRNEGLISFDREHITIIDINRLEDYI